MIDSIRLCHLVAFAQKYLDEKEAALDTLIEMEDGGQGHGKAVKLLQRVDGISASGYFKVDKHLLTSLIGHLLTYVIIMVEFKMNEMENDDGKEIAEITTDAATTTTAINYH